MVSSTRTEAAERVTIDPPIQRLLTQAINSPLKLHLALLFHENPRLEGSAHSITERIYRDIWSTREALRELADDGILGVRDSASEPIYSYCPRPEHRLPIALLVEYFNDPFARDQIHAQLRDLARDTFCRHSLIHDMAEVTSCPCCCP
ncbi:hypothetical protein SE17_05060 [Kouleothrix aurantiaca]|jgi:hypothetical protein|uniref:Uncharacterized protein n=1 Tax=Kouleothrix aurantiaca TaxID=186479 RepID=A0A0P9DVV2_9CHLR|nr:hypothetical protein SE17_05060 [Kouleothrix aurantiaca]